MVLKLRARSSPPRPAFAFSTSPPPEDDDAPAAHHPRPPGDFLPERDMHMYGAQPLEGTAFEPGRAIVRCTRCARAVSEWAAADHRRICSHVLDGAPLNVKKTAKADKRVRGGTEDGKKRSASEESPDGSPSKKRARVLLPEDLGSDEELDLSNYKGLKKSELKKLMKERERLKKRAAKEAEKAAIAERKRRRALNPLDYDRQCGVINDKGLPCSRSLTCKTHTVGAKRAVQGRTRPYDELFIEWQRAHNPNFKEPVPKKDKEAKAAAAAAAAGASAAERKAAAAKKRRAAMLGDEDGLRFDEEGHREMEELIRATRLAGERVRSVSYAMGSGLGLPFAAPAGPKPAQQPAGAKPAAAATAAAAVAVAATAAAAVPATPALAPITTTPSFPSIWRTTTYEQFSMGDLLTKALAARPRPGHGHGAHAGPQAHAAAHGRLSMNKPGAMLVPAPPAGVTA